MLKKRHEKTVAQFLAGRSPQSDADFITDCINLTTEYNKKIALAVRKATAHCCGVESIYIRANDGFSSELYILWREESLDSIDYLLYLEKCLEITFPDQEAERIIPPFSGDRTVRDAVLNVCEVIGRKDLEK